MMLFRRSAVIVMPALFCLFLATAAHSESVSGAKPAPEKWEFFVAPYFWMAGLDGKATVKGFESDIDFSFSDVWKNFDAGVQVHMEAWKGEWGILLDATYLKLSNDGSGVSPAYGPVDIDVRMEEWIVEGGGFYRFLTRPIDGERRVSVDALGGLRYISLYGKLSAFVPLVGLDTSPSGTKDWVDPFLGLRFMADITRNLVIAVRGDIGGFGVGSHFTYNASAIFGYHFSPMVSAWLGYRILGINYEDGHGPEKFKFDVTMHGPIIGIVFQF